ncbi:MAG: hypothetical protein JWQ84_2250 [Mucilaginibacter sp.]|jgi:hypothetical protein|nr:hypothetical protein [Mucilaginibacter sp.]MDB5017418.1 hypothetical protein [Mucilaginibacter sp.]
MNEMRRNKPYYHTIVVIPVGPGTSLDFVEDTIESFVYYNKLSYKIIIADDSQEGLGKKLKDTVECDVICTKKAMGGWAGLYITLSLAFNHAVENYRFNVLLKLDTDALVIGDDPQKEIVENLESSPSIGIAGQYQFDYHGEPWNIKWPQKRIINGTKTWKFFRRPIANWHLIKLHKRALKNGYETGESVFGGAYFMSEGFLIELRKLGYLPKEEFISLNLGEDHLFALLAKATGFELRNLGENGPFGCEWKGLPVAPDKLLLDKKKIIHSVRFWENLKEHEIRSFFKEKRTLDMNPDAGRLQFSN